jgi:hypothetical protein
VILALLVRISDSSRRPPEPRRSPPLSRPQPLSEASTEMVPVMGNGSPGHPAGDSVRHTAGDTA